MVDQSKYNGNSHSHHPDQSSSLSSRGLSAPSSLAADDASRIINDRNEEDTKMNQNRVRAPPALLRWLNVTINAGGVISLCLVFNLIQILATPLIPFYGKGVFILSSKMVDGIWSIIQYCFEKKNRAKVTWSGDINDIPAAKSGTIDRVESAMILSNHVSAMDWALIHSVAIRKGTLRYVKYFVKDSVKYVPGFGWGMYMANFLFLKRNWLTDQKVIKAMFDRLKRYKYPVWIVSFLEGSRVTPKKLDECRKFCQSRNLPVLNHTLFPRTKGAVATIQELRNSSVQYIYDFTIGYHHIPTQSVNSKPPSLTRIFSHDLSPEYRFHIHVRRFALDSLPKGDEELSQWIIDRWVEKDKMIGDWKIEWPKHNLLQLPSF